MSIASQISALTTDRNDIRSALVNKGVEEASFHGFDDFADDISGIVVGGGSAISITETSEAHGGTVLEITAVDLTGDTVTAARLLNGYTAHDAHGNAIVGTIAFQNIYSGSSSPSSSSGSNGDIYIQTSTSTFFKKTNGSWAQQSDLASIFTSGMNYVKR